MSILSMRLAACLGLLLVSAWDVTSEDSHLGGKCTGDVLLSQTASTKSDSGSGYVVAYGGDPGVEISCITTQDFSANKTVSTLVSGGPGSRHAVLRVEAVDGSDADFEVNIFGTGLSQTRVKRADDDCIDEPTSTNKPPLQASAEDIEKTAKRLRTSADRLEALEKLLRIMGGSLGPVTNSEY